MGLTLSERKLESVDREYYLDILKRNTNSFIKGDVKNIALLGSRKSGKTFIVKEHIKNIKDIKELVPVYIDLEKISLNPENFSIEFIGNILFNFLNRPITEYKEFLHLNSLLKFESQLSKDSFSLIKTIDNELLKIKPEQKLLVQTAFDFIQILAKENNKKFLVILDNFDNIFDLNNFSQIKDILSIINFNSQNVCYVVTSSAIKECISRLKNFDCYEIKNFDKKEIFNLVESFFGKKEVDNEKISGEVFSLTNGNLYITLLLLKKLSVDKNVSLKRTFLIELLKKKNAIYDYCNECFNYYYNHARGQTLLKTILKVVAKDELRLSEIAKHIYRSAPVTKSILERLMDVDIIYKKDNRFYFSDNVLRLWIKLTSQGYEFDDIPDDKTLDEIEKEL